MESYETTELSRWYKHQLFFMEKSKISKQQINILIKSQFFTNHFLFYLNQFYKLALSYQPNLDPIAAGTLLLTLLLKYHSVNQRQGMEIERLSEILRCAFLILVTVTASSVFYSLWIDTLLLKYHSADLRQGFDICLPCY